MPKALILSAGAEDELVRICLTQSRQEQVGLLLGSGRRIVSAVPLQNLHKRSSVKGFRVALNEVAACGAEARKEGLTIVGRFHTHPNAPAYPSAADIASLPPDWAEIIVQVRCISDRTELGDIYAYAGANVPLELTYAQRAA